MTVEHQKNKIKIHTTTGTTTASTARVNNVNNSPIGGGLISYSRHTHTYQIINLNKNIPAIVL